MNAFVILMIGAGVLIVLLAGIVGMRSRRRRDRSGGIVNPPPVTTAATPTSTLRKV